LVPGSSFVRAGELTEDASTVFEQKGDAYRVSLAGRITIDSSPEFRILLFEHLRSLGFERLIIDFEGVDYIDTSGLAVLIEALKAARVEGKSISLSDLREQPRYLLEATRWLHLFGEVDAA
jgi:anti-anti-sigma factor